MIYTAKNDLVLSQVSLSDIDILDVGCGTGSNARSIATYNPQSRIVGLSHNAKELDLASEWIARGIEFNLNSESPLELDKKFDLIICSHILEHLIDPAQRTRELSKFLKPSGRMILVVPNFAIWKSRLRLLFGKFDYAEHGLYDSSHLRFYTWHSFGSLVVPEDFEITKRLSSGNFPMPFLRKLIPIGIGEKIDNFFVKNLPNIFSSEVGLIIRRKKTQ